MKVHSIAKAAGSMAQIAETGGTPIGKKPIQTTGTDARAWARDLVCTAFEQDAAHGEVRQSRCMAIMQGTVDGRQAIVEECKFQMQMLREIDDPRTASLRTTASVMTRIALACNAGASVEGLQAYYSDKGLAVQDMTEKHIVDYARSFLESVGEGSAKGRKVKGVLSRLDSMLKDCTDAKVFAKLSDDDKVILKRLQAFRAQFDE
jgi:hypothetical protein